MGFAVFGQIIFLLLVSILGGIAFGAAFLSSAPAIVLSFALPLAWSALGFIPWLDDARRLAGHDAHDRAVHRGRRHRHRVGPARDLAGAVARAAAGDRPRGGSRAARSALIEPAQQPLMVPAPGERAGGQRERQVAGSLGALEHALGDRRRGLVLALPQQVDAERVPVDQRAAPGSTTIGASGWARYSDSPSLTTSTATRVLGPRGHDRDRRRVAGLLAQHVREQQRAAGLKLAAELGGAALQRRDVAAAPSLPSSRASVSACSAWLTAASTARRSDARRPAR